MSPPNGSAFPPQEETEVPSKLYTECHSCRKCQALHGITLSKCGGCGVALYCVSRQKPFPFLVALSDLSYRAKNARERRGLATERTAKLTRISAQTSARAKTLPLILLFRLYRSCQARFPNSDSKPLT